MNYIPIPLTGSSNRHDSTFRTDWLMTPLIDNRNFYGLFALTARINICRAKSCSLCRDTSASQIPSSLIHVCIYVWAIISRPPVRPEAVALSQSATYVLVPPPGPYRSRDGTLRSSFAIGYRDTGFQETRCWLINSRHSHVCCHLHIVKRIGALEQNS